MVYSLFARTILLPIVCIVLFPTSIRAEEKSPARDPRNVIIKLRDSGLEPSAIEMSVEDAILFLLNDTSSSLTTIEIDYGDKETHCASENLEILPGGKVRSKKPFSPNDFASVCFHDPGDYKLTAYGLSSQPNGISTVIRVKK